MFMPTIVAICAHRRVMMSIRDISNSRRIRMAHSLSTHIQRYLNKFYSLWKILYLLQTKYLKIQTSSSQSAASVIFCANEENKSKFVLIFHPQKEQDKQHPGILVDIYSLANGCFLSPERNPDNQLVVTANSAIAPLDKFLIIVEGVEW